MEDEVTVLTAIAETAVTKEEMEASTGAIIMIDAMEDIVGTITIVETITKEEMTEDSIGEITTIDEMEDMSVEEVTETVIAEIISAVEDLLIGNEVRFL